jgi:tetratricopeptide (TPR) repeat protein
MGLIPPPQSGSFLRKSTYCVSLCLLFMISSCLAPKTTEPPLRPETEAPYESMAAAIAVGDPEQALSEYDKALKEEPQSRLTRLLHARLLVIAGKLDEAREEFNLLLADDPKDTDALYNISVLEGLSGNKLAQKEFLLKVTNIDPAYSDALAALGDIALEEKDVSAADSYFTKALSSDSKNLVALLGEGALLTQNKEYAKAAEAFTKAIEVEPDYPFSYVDRARARQNQGDIGGAITDLSRAIQLDPGYSWSYLDRGKLYIRNGQADFALEDFSIAIELDPEIFAGYALRAELYLVKGSLDEALADFTKLVSLKPDYNFAYEPMGTARYEKSDWAGAREAFLKAYSYQGENFSYPLLAALCLRREGKGAQASQYLQSVIRDIPRDSWYYDVARYLIDPVAGDFSFVARVNSEKEKYLKARLLFYAAAQYLTDGKNLPAMKWLLDAESSLLSGAVETPLARWELSRLGVK